MAIAVCGRTAARLAVIDGTRLELDALFGVVAATVAAFV